MTLTTTYEPATDLGFLLHKHPKKLHTFSFTFGQAHVFYPQAEATQCSAALVIDIEPASLHMADDSRHINDRAYRASALLSVAIAQVYGDALQGHSQEQPQLVQYPLPLQAQIALVSAEQRLLQRLFQPLGYQVVVHPVADDNPYYVLKLQAQCSLQTLLTHIYGLIPVLDADKYQWLGAGEMNTIWQHCQNWLTQHPEQALIQHGYAQVQSIKSTDNALSSQDLNVISRRLKTETTRRVVDIYQHPQFVEWILKDKFFKKIVALELETSEPLQVDKLPIWQRKRLQLFRFKEFNPDKQRYGYEAVTVLNVFEQLDDEQRQALTELLFNAMKPKVLIITTQKTTSIPFCQAFPTWSQEIAQQFHYEAQNLNNLSVQLSLFTQC